MMRSRSFFSASGSRLFALGLAITTTVASAGPAVAQYPNPSSATQPDVPSPGVSMSRPRFSADATIQPGASGTPEVRVDYRLARSELLFERKPDGYHAAYEVRIIVSNEKGNKQVAGDGFTRVLHVPRYADTIVQGEDIVDHLTFQVPPGSYVVEVLVTDLTAERTSSTSVPVEVPGVAGEIWITDLSVGIARVDSSGHAPDPESLDPNPSRRFAENVTRFAATGEIVDNRPLGAPDSTYKLRYRIQSDLDSEIARGDTSIARRGARTRFVIRPNLGLLSPGSYRLVLDLLSPLVTPKGKKKPTPIRREKPFTVEQSAVTATLDPRTTLEVLRYIARDEELKEMDGLRTQEEKKAFWEAFWLRRDPGPETPQNEAMEEFYKRVRYADQHFGVGGVGWKTDMGRIYIQFGQPDEIVRNPFRFDGPPEEIWYYYRERKTFYFVDRDGFSRYELDETRTQ